MPDRVCGRGHGKSRSCPPPGTLKRCTIYCDLRATGHSWTDLFQEGDCLAHHSAGGARDVREVLRAVPGPQMLQASVVMLAVCGRVNEAASATQVPGHAQEGAGADDDEDLSPAR
jgi:hypothetical protein